MSVGPERQNHNEHGLLVNVPAKHEGTQSTEQQTPKKVHGTRTQPETPQCGLDTGQGQV